MAYILSKHADNIGTLTFNHQEKHNALNNALIGEMIAALEELQARKVRAVILRAQKGAKVWSSGFDITELPRPGRDPLSYYDPHEQAIRAIEHFPAPIIAMVEGSVWGGACELAFSCDLLIGTASASFAITPARIGVPYNLSGILHFVNLLGVNRVKEMFFTARPINAERALQIGILNHLMPEEELESFTYEMARGITANSPLSISVIKEQMRLLSKAHSLAPETFERVQGLRRQVYDSHDYQEGIRAFLEKRSPLFRGA